MDYEPWMDVNRMLWDQAKKYWDAGEDENILICKDNMDGLEWVIRHDRVLRKRGTYEKSLLHAYASTRTNWCHYSLDDLRYLFLIADREKLLLAGDPLPEQETFTLYRGVSGRGKNRRVSGISWTSDLELANWFAQRYKEYFEDPAVYVIKIGRERIYARLHDSQRKENEYIIPFLDNIRPKRLRSQEGV